MKKHLIAAAALATLSTVAFAQSATVYGIFDLSMTRTSNINAAGQSQTSLTDAVWMPSVFGLTGSEDLGGGMKATFNLESDVNVDRGAFSGASGGKLFGRKSNIAISGGFGELKLGKDIDQIFLQGFIDNVRNSHSSSGFIAHAVATNAGLDTETVFTENMIRYTTPSVGGVKAAVQRRMGEQAGDSGKNSSTSVLVTYANGGLTLAGGFKEMESLTNAKTELSYVGATYQLGAVRLSATHHKTQFKTTGAADVKTTEFGVGYAVSPKLTAAVNYVSLEQGAAEGDVTSASLKYALSKRTSLWTLVSRTNNDGYAVFGGQYLHSPAKDGTSTSVGITHSF